MSAAPAILLFPRPPWSGSSRRSPCISPNGTILPEASPCPSACSGSGPLTSPSPAIWAKRPRPGPNPARAYSFLNRRSFRDCGQVLRRNHEQVVRKPQTASCDPFGGRHPMFHPAVYVKNPGVFVPPGQLGSLDQLAFQRRQRRHGSPRGAHSARHRLLCAQDEALRPAIGNFVRIFRSEEHTSELQSPCNLVC